MPDQITIDITALAAQLQQAWAPAFTRRAPDDEGYEDEDDGDYCTGYGGCACEQCHYNQYRGTQFCSRWTTPPPNGVRCGKPTRYEVSGWSVGAGRVEAQYLDPSLEGPARFEWIDFDERVVPLSGTYTACSQEHAYAIAKDLRARYNRDPDDPNPMRFKIEARRYEPHRLDLPEILQEVRDAARSLSANADALVRAGCRVPDVARFAFSPAQSLVSARRAAAQLVGYLAQLDTRERPGPRYRQGDPRPEVLRSVKGADGVPYDCDLVDGTAWRAWRGGRQFDSWEQMLTELGEVAEWPQDELVLPGEPTGWEADHG